MSIVDRASDAARLIANDKLCWRCLMMGTILTGGLALASVAAGPATAADLINTGVLDVQGLISGNIVNSGTLVVTGPLSASGSNLLNGSGALLNVGANIFSNIGTLTNDAARIINIAGGTIGAITTVNAGTINISGLSTINGSLTNSGVINLQNNVAGDRLTVTGNFTGAPGSTIALDVNARAGIADQIVIAGNASGSTTLNVAGLTPGNPFTIGPNLVVVQGTASLNAFVLGNVLNLGTLLDVLLRLPNGTGVSFAPATIPSSAGLSGAAAKSAMQTSSFVSNEVAFDRMWDLRNAIRGNSSQGTRAAATAYAQEFATDDPISPYVRAEAGTAAREGIGNPKPAAWIKGYGDYEQRDGEASFSFAGTNFTSNLGYRQGTGGVMGGIDSVWSGLTSPTDGLILGLLGGYTYSRVELRDSPTNQVFSGPSVGAYGTYLTGNWFFDLLFKVDLLSLDIGLPGISQSANPTNYNLATNIGYKFELPNHYYIEPTAGLEYVRTNFDHAAALTATTVALNDGDALRTRAGARVGTEWVSGNVRVEPSLLALVWEISEASNNALLVNDTSISLPSDVGRVRGELQGLINVFDVENRPVRLRSCRYAIWRRPMERGRESRCALSVVMILRATFAMRCLFKIAQTRALRQFPSAQIFAARPAPAAVPPRVPPSGVRARQLLGGAPPVRAPERLRARPLPIARLRPQDPAQGWGAVRLPLSARFAAPVAPPPSRPVLVPHYFRLCSPSWMSKKWAHGVHIAPLAQQ